MSSTKPLACCTRSRNLLRTGRTLRSNRPAQGHRIPAGGRAGGASPAGARPGWPLAARSGHHRTRDPCRRSTAGGVRGGTASAARRHRRKRAGISPRGNVAGLRGRIGTSCGPSRYGPGRGTVADDRGLGRQSVAGPHRRRHPSGRIAKGGVQRPSAGRGVPARLGAKRGRTRAWRGERVGAGARRPGRRDRCHLGVRPDRPDGPPPGVRWAADLLSAADALTRRL